METLEKKKELVIWRILDELQKTNNKEKLEIHITPKEVQLLGYLLIDHNENTYLERLEKFYDIWIETKQVTIILAPILIRLIKDLYVFLRMFESAIAPSTICSLLKIMLFLLASSKLYDDEETKAEMTKELFTVVDEMICASTELMNITKRKKRSCFFFTGTCM